jgi:hypothetical protein
MPCWEPKSQTLVTAVPYAQLGHASPLPCRLLSSTAVAKDCSIETFETHKILLYEIKHYIERITRDKSYLPDRINAYNTACPLITSTDDRSIYTVTEPARKFGGWLVSVPWLLRADDLW